MLQKEEVSMVKHVTIAYQTAVLAGNFPQRWVPDSTIQVFKVYLLVSQT